MRRRDMLTCWQQIRACVGIDTITDKEWSKAFKFYQLSWERLYYVTLNKKDGVGGSAAVVAGRRRTSTVFVGSSPAQCRNATTPLSASSFGVIKRRNSVVPRTSPNKQLYAKGQTCNSPIGRTPNRRSTVAVDSYGTDDHPKKSLAELFPKPLAVPQDSVIPAVETIDLPETSIPIKHLDSVAWDLLTTPIQSISPLAPTPIKRRESEAFDQLRNRKESVSPSNVKSPDSVPLDQWKKEPVSSEARRRRDSSDSAREKSKRYKQKPLQNLKSVVKHVTGSGDELDDEMALSAWKEYSRSLCKASEESTEKALPPQKLSKETNVIQQVKRKRGRPSREDKAKQMKEQQALKNVSQASEPENQPNPDWTLEDLDVVGVSSLPAKAPQPHEDLREAWQQRPKQRKTTSSQSTISRKKKPAAKARSVSISSVGDQEEADIDSPTNLINEDAIPPAHMPTMATNFKCLSQAPFGDKVKEKNGKEEEEEQDYDFVRSRPNLTAYENNRKDCRSRYKRIIGCLSSDEDDGEHDGDEEQLQLLCKKFNLLPNDYEVEKQLLDAAMAMTSPIGGGEGDKGDDIALDLIVKEKDVTNQIPLTNTEIERTIDEYLADMPSESETLNASKALSEIDHQLTHATKFFEELSSRPPIDVSVDKSNLLFPYMEEDEVLDYEEDYDVLTLVISSDDLEDDDRPSKPSKQSKPGEQSASSNQSQMLNGQLELPPSPKVDVQPKSMDEPQNPKAESLNTYRIPKINPDLLKEQPSVMHSVYLQEDRNPNSDKVKKSSRKTVDDEARKKREKERSARQSKKTMPQFAPPFRHQQQEHQQPPPPDESSVREDLPTLFVPQDVDPQFMASQNLAPKFVAPQNTAPLFTPDDLDPISSTMRAAPLRHPTEASQYAAEHFVPKTGARKKGHILHKQPPQPRHPRETPSKYIPENLATSGKNIRADEGSTSRGPTGGISATHWMMQIFGLKCPELLNNKCQAVHCDHTTSTVGEVESRLLSMSTDALYNTYKLALRTYYIFGLFFKSFADIFERRKLSQHLMQMLVNCCQHLYPDISAPLVRHVFGALKRCGLEREATHCIMTDMLKPERAHKFREQTLAILDVLRNANWTDYVDQLIDLHKTHKFPLPEEYMIRIIKWGEATNNEELQKKGLMMVLDDINKYSLNPAICGIIERYSAGETNPALIPYLAPQEPVAGAQQQHQYPASNWNHHPHPNLIPQQDRLPGAAGSGPSLIGRSPAQYSALKWNNNTNPQPNLGRLPGASPSPLVIRSATAPGQQQHPQYPGLTWNNTNPNRDPLPGAVTGSSLILGGQTGQQQQQQPQQYPATNWSGQANNLNGAEKNSFRHYPAGFE